MHPYRQDGDRPIWTFEAEVDALRVLGERKSTLHGRWLALAFIAMFPSMGLAFALHQRLYGADGHDLTALLSCLAAVGLEFLLSYAVYRLILRRRRRAWLATIAADYGVPPEQLAPLLRGE
jgi:hypothetical protein